MKKYTVILITLILPSAVFASTDMTKDLSDLGQSVAGETEKLTKEGVEAGAGFIGQELGLNALEKAAHPFTLGRRPGYCLYENAFEQYFPDCAEAADTSIESWKECCHQKTKQEVSVEVAAAWFKKSMSQGIFGMKKQKN